MGRTFSATSKLVDLEAVVNTRTPLWDIDGSGDICIKLDTDVNGQQVVNAPKGEQLLP